MTSFVGLILAIGWMDFYANHVIICYIFKINPTLYYTPCFDTLISFFFFFSTLITLIYADLH